MTGGSRIIAFGGSDKDNAHNNALLGARSEEAVRGGSPATDVLELTDIVEGVAEAGGSRRFSPIRWLFPLAAMLAAAGLQGHEEVGVIPGRNAVVVAEKAAINAVMAGCRPEYMPVVVAAVKSLCAPAFAYHGPASSTGGSAMALVVNGPIARRLGINSGNNAFGQGHRANATIGRPPSPTASFGVSEGVSPGFALSGPPRRSHAG